MYLYYHNGLYTRLEERDAGILFLSGHCLATAAVSEPFRAYSNVQYSTQYRTVQVKEGFLSVVKQMPLGCRTDGDTRASEDEAVV